MSLLEHCPDVLTIPKAAKLLGMPVSTMRELVESGKIEQIPTIGPPVIFRACLENYLEKNRQACYSGSGTTPASAEQHLDNENKSDFMPSSEGDTEMARKINQSVIINGEKRWITANSMQEFTDKILKLTSTPQTVEKHAFNVYAWNWFHTYSEPNIETATATTYKRQLTLHLIPALGSLNVEDITTDDLQRLFNAMTGTKTTKDKARMVLNQILDAAVEDKLLTSNPLKSRRLKITGKASEATTPYSTEQMRYLVQHIGDIQNPIDRAYMALQALHPLRLEEVLGLQGADIDPENRAIHIRRAVTHPDRNQPEIKDTKTASSHRTIGLSSLALPHILDVPANKFVFGGDKPLSYTQVRKMCNRIKRDTGFTENITPIRFRTTVLTDIYDQTKDIKLAQAAAGHTTSAMTLKYYVKGREVPTEATAAIEQAYSA